MGKDQRIVSTNYTLTLRKLYLSMSKRFYENLTFDSLIKWSFLTSHELLQENTDKPFLLNTRASLSFQPLLVHSVHAARNGSSCPWPTPSSSGIVSSPRQQRNPWISSPGFRDVVVVVDWARDCLDRSIVRREFRDTGAGFLREGYSPLGMNFPMTHFYFICSIWWKDRDD